MTEGDKAGMTGVVIQGGACYKEGLRECLLRTGGVYGVGVCVGGRGF